MKDITLKSALLHPISHVYKAILFKISTQA